MYLLPCVVGGESNVVNDNGLFMFKSRNNTNATRENIKEQELIARL